MPDSQDAKYRDILYEEKDHVATITFNRPDRLNAFREGMYEEVTDAIVEASWNRQISAIVLTGAGNRAFGVGGDLGDKKKAPSAYRSRICTARSATRRSRSSPRFAVTPSAAATCWPRCAT